MHGGHGACTDVCMHCILGVRPCICAFGHSVQKRLDITVLGTANLKQIIQNLMSMALILKTINPYLFLV